MNQNGITSTMTRRPRLANSAPNAIITTADVGYQSFYVTLDISSAMDHSNPRTKKKNPDPLPPKCPQPETSIAPTTPMAQDGAGPSDPQEGSIAEILAPMDIDQTLCQTEGGPSFPEPKDRIQIADLHTQNPLISYQNQLYSCEWTSTLGTDLLLIDPAPGFSHPVLREKLNVSLLAASSIKLMGRSAQIANRHKAEAGGQSSTPAPENSMTAANTIHPEIDTQVKIPLGPEPSRARQTQANFLERLIGIKAKKGEKDSVTVYSQKVNQGTGWRSQRKASEAFEDGEDETTPKRIWRGKDTGGRPRGSRRTRGSRTAKGGLFRDYRPQLWDMPGADIRAGPSSTPESWDQLEGGASDGRQTPLITTTNASPSGADQAAQMPNRSTGPHSTSVSANASPTPSFRPVRSTNDESTSSTAQAPPSPSPVLASAVQPAIVTEESTASASRMADTKALQQEQTEGLNVERSTPAPDTATENWKTSGLAKAGDVEIENV